MIDRPDDVGFGRTVGWLGDNHGHAFLLLLKPFATLYLMLNILMNTMIFI